MSRDSSRPEEVGRRGETLYKEKIEYLVDPLHFGKFVVLDVETGDFEVDENGSEASRRLRERKPGAVTYRVRVGFSAALRMGGRNLERGQ